MFPVHIYLLPLPADVILVSPAWTTYAPQARLARGDGKEPLIVETAFEDEWKLTPRALRAALDRRAKEEKFDKSKKWLMVLNNPGNPCERERKIVPPCIPITCKILVKTLFTLTFQLELPTPKQS